MGEAADPGCPSRSLLIKANCVEKLLDARTVPEENRASVSLAGMNDKLGEGGVFILAPRKARS
jgi:hypothetical protein